MRIYKNNRYQENYHWTQSTQNVSEPRGVFKQVSLYASFYINHYYYRCPELTPSFGTMTTPNFDDAIPLCITYNNRSQPPHDYSLTPWSQEDLCVIFEMQLNIALLVGIFRFSYDSAFTWMLLGLNHDKSSLLQEWLGAISQQAITSRHYLSQCWPRSTSPYGVTHWAGWASFKRITPVC